MYSTRRSRNLSIVKFAQCRHAGDVRSSDRDWCASALVVGLELTPRLSELQHRRSGFCYPLRLRWRLHAINPPGWVWTIRDNLLQQHAFAGVKCLKAFQCYSSIVDRMISPIECRWHPHTCSESCSASGIQLSITPPKASLEFATCRLVI
jgi:hypothetical protein